MVIWADFFVFLERGFLGKMVGTDMLMDVMVEVVIGRSYRQFNSEGFKKDLEFRERLWLVWWRWSVV